MNEEATASDSPLIQGRNARLYGKSRESCPYSEGSPEREGWMDGFGGEDAVTLGDAGHPADRDQA